MNYYHKYLKYKKKYLNLYGGVIIRDINSNPPNPRCSDECFFCAEETTPEERVILSCGCCFHIKCLNYQMNLKIRDRTSLGPTGVKCPNVSTGECTNPEINITPDDLNQLYETDLTIPEDQRINTEQLAAMIALNSAPTNLIFEGPIDPYILATTKRCPGLNCGQGISHFHGHHCHHMTCNNQACRNKFCYICVSDRATNERERGLYCFCACPPIVDDFGDLSQAVWGTFCKPIENPEDIILNPVPHDRRCGCVFCPECRPGSPCSTCPGTCAVCVGIVKPGPLELYNETMGPSWLVDPLDVTRSIIRDEGTNKFFRYTDTKENITIITLSKGKFKVLGGLFTGLMHLEYDWFMGFTALQSLILTNNSIQTIQKNTFVPISQTLVTLKISDNPLSIFPSEIKRLVNLQKLTIIKSKIKELPERLFESNTRLLELDLRYNNINNVHSLAFLGSNLESINLSNNNISRMFNLPPSLVKLNLSKNSFEKIGKIESVDRIIPLEIEIINLSSNKITEIETKTFFRLSHLKVIILDKNPIRWIREKAFLSCDKLYSIKLSKVDPNFRLLTNSYQNLPSLKSIFIDEINVKP